MYVSTFGGSGLLHLLAAHPRAIAVLGIVATVSMLRTPLGVGRYVGSGEYLAKLERSLVANELVTAARRSTAERRASAMLESGNTAAMQAAVATVLVQCGAGCTDVSMDAVINDLATLRRVLVLHELDRAMAEDAPGGMRASGARGTSVSQGD